MIPRTYLKIGLGGIINFEMMTFDFCSGHRLKPYLAKIIGEDSVYRYKREFVNGEKTTLVKRFYGDSQMYAITFKLQKYVVYEYKRFPGNTLGEVEEGYFVILTNEIRELDQEELRHWIRDPKEKEKSTNYKQNTYTNEETHSVKKEKENKKAQQLELFDYYAREDVDF